jgi:hypothetical protein
VREVDALREAGAGSLPAVAEELDPERGLVIITEGLLAEASVTKAAKLVPQARAAGSGLAHVLQAAT